MSRLPPELACGSQSHHPGRACINVPVHHFNIQGILTTYPCDVYKPARESILSFQNRMPNGKVPVEFVKPWLFSTLQTLDFTQSVCHIRTISLPICLSTFEHWRHLRRSKYIANSNTPTRYSETRNESLLATIEDDAVLQDFAQN